MYLTVWIISNNIRIYRIWFAHGTREDSLTSSLITLDDICWSFVLAGSGPVTWRNFQISNCERCLTKVRTQSMKRRRNMRQKMIMRRTKMTWMMSWMRWCWCRTQTEALSVSELQSSVQDSLLRSWTSDWPSANAFYRQIVCACVGGKGLLLQDCPKDGAKISDGKLNRYSAALLKVLLFLSNYTPACKGFYINCLLHRQICIVCNLNIPFYPIEDRKMVLTRMLSSLMLWWI